MSGPREWRLGVVSDAHLSPASAEPYVWQNTVDLPHSAELLDTGLRWLATQELDQLVLLGDLTEAADGDSFANVRERVEAIGVPVLAVPGNCDVALDDRSLTAFESIAGDPVRIGPAVFELEPGVAFELVHLEAAEGKRLRGVRASEPDLPLHVIRVLLTHYPVLDLEPELLAAGFRHSGNLVNRAEIEADLRALELPVVVIHGHLHIHDTQISGNLLHLSCAALIEPPHQVSVIEIRAGSDGFTVERWAHSVRVDAVERVPVFAPERGCWRWADGAWSECG